MKYLVIFSRVFVGSLFIVSGLIKGNDVIGFSYKLGEYFEEAALDLVFLEPYAVILSVLACVAEILLGFAVIFGTKIKLATWSLVGLTVFFGWLTLYTATCDPQATYQSPITVQENSDRYFELKARSENEETLTFIGSENGNAHFEEEKAVVCVTDCGCFGDAMKGSIGRSLTPWESFYKDLILFIFLIPILIWQNKIKVNSGKEDLILLPLSILFIAIFSWVFTWYMPIVFALVGFAGYVLSKVTISRFKSEWPTVAWVVLISLIFIHRTYNHLPVRDYRPYAIGKNLVDGMKSCEELGEQCPIYNTVFLMKNKTTGEEIEIYSHDYSYPSLDLKDESGAVNRYSAVELAKMGIDLNNSSEFLDSVLSAKNYTKVASYPPLYMDKNLDFIKSVRSGVQIRGGYEPTVADFVFLNNEGFDVTDSLLKSDLVFLLVEYDINHTAQSKSVHSKINDFAREAEKKNVWFVAATSSNNDLIDEFRHEHSHSFEYLMADGTMLKTIIRSHPGLVAISNGTVIGKWHYNDIKSFSETLKELNIN